MRILGRETNAPLVFLFVGLILGALVGYGTRPEKTAEIRIGPLNLEVQGRNIARDQGGKLDSDQIEHIAIITLIGGTIGFGLGFAIQRGKISA
jgi:hypothetical protein